MKKLLRPQEILLLGLAGAFDVFNKLRDPFGTIGNAYKNIYGFVPGRFKKTNYNRLVQRSLQTGYIEKIVNNGEVILRITSAGREKIQRDFSFVRFQNKKWDRKWRVVIFDIKEKERKQRDWLRDKLKEIGFGMIQESVWISPYDIGEDFREFVVSLGLGEDVFVMEVNQILMGNTKALVSKIWHTESINERYRKLFEMTQKWYDRTKLLTGKEREKELKTMKIALRNQYLEILIKDPCLPKELLPEDWYGRRLRNCLRGG